MASNQPRPQVLKVTDRKYVITLLGQTPVILSRRLGGPHNLDRAVLQLLPRQALGRGVL